MSESEAGQHLVADARNQIVKLLIRHGKVARSGAVEQHARGIRVGPAAYGQMIQLTCPREVVPGCFRSFNHSMPLYEYECPRTGKRFEVIQKFSDEPVKRCPECDEHAECPGEAKKILSAPAIRFKGAGWYVNDYGKGDEKPKPEAKSESSESKSETKSETKSEAKSESKSEAKSETKSTDSKPAAESE